MRAARRPAAGPPARLDAQPAPADDRQPSLRHPDRRRETAMATTSSTEIARVTSVAIDPATDAAELYRSARVAGFPANPSLNLRRYPGKTIEHLTFTHVYLGGAARWRPDDVQQIDWALPA